MTKLNWTLEDLKLQLNSHPSIKGWIITEEHIHRRERYFLQENNRLGIDQDRNVRVKNISVKIMVKLTTPGRQGEISKKFFSTMPLKEQIEAGIEAAMQTDHQSWELPPLTQKEIPQVLSTDPRMAEDLNGVMNQLTNQISSAVQRKRNSTFNSAELFLSVHDRELHLSSGLTHRSSQSRIYTEAAFSFEEKDTDGKVRSDEYLNSTWSVNLNQLSIQTLFDEAANRAEHSLAVCKPNTGRYSVIIDADVIATLLCGYIAQLWASNAYHGLPFIQKDQAFISQPRGDLLSITLDPTLEFGADTVALSNQGLTQSPLKLVSQNQVIATVTDKQFADYLGTSPTTVRGNISVEPGTLSHQELTQQDPIVLEILQFSGLFADPNSGTFSSEIRLAKLYDNKNGKITYIKGGSLSGSIRDNFKGLKLSKSTTLRSHFSSDQSQGQGYCGPEFALLTDVSVVG